MTKAPAPTKDKSFEATLDRLETIVKRLESGQVPLEEAIRMHEEGTRLKAHCIELLRKAETKLERIVTGTDTVISTQSESIPEKPL